MRRVRMLVAAAGAAAMIAVAGCGGGGNDNGGNGNGGNGNGGNGNGGTEARIEASSVTFAGEELPIHQIMCGGSEGDRHVTANVGDPDDNVFLFVEETSDNARLRLTRGQGTEFHGHSWYASSPSPDEATIDSDGARGDLELRWDTSSGNDEPSEAEDEQITFELSCA